MAEQSNSALTNNGTQLRDNHGNIIFEAPVSKESELRRILDIMLTAEIDEIEEVDISAYQIDGEGGKLEYNNVKGEWLDIIYEYPIYEDIIYTALNDNESGIPQINKFLMQLNRDYKKAKRELKIPLNCQDSVRTKSDEILDKVTEYHMKFLRSKGEVKEHYDESHVKVLVAFGFIECKILEKPTTEL